MKYIILIYRDFFTGNKIILRIYSILVNGNISIFYMLFIKYFIEINYIN